MRILALALFVVAACGSGKLYNQVDVGDNERIYEGMSSDEITKVMGDDAAYKIIAGKLEKAVNDLGADLLVMAECGHGFRSQRWEAENWLGRSYPFKVMSFVELQAEYIRQKRLNLDPSVNTKRVTYHDPCNQVRQGGIIEEPRYVLRHVVKDFVEMEPHGVDNFCCGGGGGMLSMSEFAKDRIAAGKVKADQIQATGAEIVATSFHNCLDQLDEIRRHYKLKVKVQNLSELTAAAIGNPSAHPVRP